jgi:hypothetical protein
MRVGRVFRTLGDGRGWGWLLGTRRRLSIGSQWLSLLETNRKVTGFLGPKAGREPDSTVAPSRAAHHVGCL